MCLPVWENASSDDQLVKRTKVSKHLAVVIHFTKTVLSHNCLKTCIFALHLGVKISKQHYQVVFSYSFYDTL